MTVPGPASRVVCLPVPMAGEIVAGEDLVARVSQVEALHDGDVVVLTSKAVSKAAGRTVPATSPQERAAVVADETDRVLARRGGTRIVRTRHGLVMAAAGVDASNTVPGVLVLLPEDPDRSARDVRERLAAAGVNVAVVVSDTFGRAWRTGQADVAVGAAGLMPTHDYAGVPDAHGVPLHVTSPAVADEIAAAADLVKGKLAGTPAAVLRGLDHLVLPPGQHGPGAAALVREEAGDMFGLGAREAVTAAATRTEPRGFGSPAPAADLLEGLRAVVPGAIVEADSPGLTVGLVSGDRPEDLLRLGAEAERVGAVAFAHGWRVGPAAVGADEPTRLLLRPSPWGP